jgi:hypothetical protein
MLHVLALMVMFGKTDSMLKAHDLFCATEARLKQVVGPRTSSPREPGIRFARAGFYEVWVDGAGPGMHHIRLALGSLVPWKRYLTELGLGTGHARAIPQPVAASPIPLYRHKLSIEGAKGLPDKAWKVTFVEYAVANKARLRAHKAEITSLPVGEDRNRVIRSCYDWWSEVDLTR